MSSQVLLDASEIEQTIAGLISQISEIHSDLSQLVFVGILTNGFPLAQRLSSALLEKTGVDVPVGKLDVSLYRDDILSQGKFITIRESDIPFDLTGRIIVLVDDVLFHGRTIRAAMDGLLDYGRPSRIELAVLIDRGHRELPIMANYVGQSVETSADNYVSVRLYEVEGDDKILLE